MIFFKWMFLELLGDIRRIQRSTTGDVFALPSFDHTVGDPVEGDVVIDTRKTRIIVFEGLYLQLDRDVWRDIHSLMHISIFISIDRQIAFERLVQRHVLCGLGERVRSDGE